MSDTKILPFASWMRLNNGKGTKDGYITYVKEQEDIIRQHTLKDLIENPYGIEDDESVGDMSDREVQEQLLILTSKNFKKLNIISNISIFFLVITIISIVFSLAGLSLLSL